MVCSHLALINVDLELATRLGGGTFRQVQNNFLRIHSRLRTGLNQVSGGQYDLVIVDCPPNFNIVTKTAIVASDHILIPAIPDYLSTLGIDQLQRHVRQLVEDFNKFATEAGGEWVPINPNILGAVLTMIRVYSGSPMSTQQQYISQLIRMGVPIFDTFIRKNDRKYGSAPQYGVPVVLQPAYGGTYESVKKELEALATEFARKIA